MGLNLPRLQKYISRLIWFSLVNFSTTQTSPKKLLKFLLEIVVSPTILVKADRLLSWIVRDELIFQMEMFFKKYEKTNITRNVTRKILPEILPKKWRILPDKYYQKNVSRILPDEQIPNKDQLQKRFLLDIHRQNLNREAWFLIWFTLSNIFDVLDKYWYTKSLGALRAPTSRVRPFGPAW